MINELTIAIPHGPPIEMVRVEGGGFQMGSEEYGDEKPVHPVTLSGFYLGRYPVTQAQWQAVMGKNPSRFIGANRPVERVSWQDCQAFLGQLHRLTGRAFRLPTEAQWEYAARGGCRSRGFRYAGSDRPDEVGWYDENSYGETKPVGLKLANELGLFDMSGNVSEWCADRYDDEYYARCAEAGVVVDPAGPDQGAFRVQRGGSYFSSAGFCHASGRLNRPTEEALKYNGLRLALPGQSVG